MKINIEIEYNTLRSEIISQMEMQTNLRIAMYTVSIALFSVAVDKQSPVLCALVFAVIIPFSLIIHSKQISIMRASAYIIVYFERKYTNLNWETKVTELSNDFKSKNTIMHLLMGFVNYGLSSILGIIIFIFYLLFLKKKTALSIIIIVVLLILTLMIDILTNSLKIRDAYIKEFSKIK